MASDKGAAGMGMALPIDPLTTSIVRPRDIFAALLVRDDALRAAGIETVFERLRHYEAVADTDPTGNARGTLMVLLPTVLRLTYEWCVHIRQAQTMIGPPALRINSLAKPDPTAARHRRLAPVRTAQVWQSEVASDGHVARPFVSP